MSIEFRRDNLNGAEYLARSLKLIDTDKNLKEKFFDIVKEMIVLLPDILKQNELFRAYDELVTKLDVGSNNADSSLSNRNIWGGSNQTNLSDKLIKCEFCSQYFQNSEANFHKSRYHSSQMKNFNTKLISNNKKANKNEQDDFPALVPTKPITAQTSQSKSSSSSTAATTLTAASLLISSQSNIKKEEIENDMTKTKPLNKPIKMLTEEFPPLGGVDGNLTSNGEIRYSALPTPSIFSNPSSHLSLVNKKKHRLQK